MNELELIADLGDAAAPDERAMDDALAALMAEIRGESPRPAGRAAPGRRTPTLSRRLRHLSARRWPLIAVAASAVLALAIWGIVGTGENSAPDGMLEGPAIPAQTPSTPITTPTDPTGPDPSTAASRAAAAAVLARAAVDIRHIAEPEPRPDQYLYVSDTSGYQAWLSIDGEHDGEVISGGRTIPAPGCVNGISLQYGNSPTPRSVPCVPQPIYLADAPTDPAAMAQYVMAKALPGKPGQAAPPPDAQLNAIAKTILGLVTHAYLTPAARAALYQALPLIPGLDLRAAPGSPGQTVVSWTFGTTTHGLVFDDQDGSYLGFVSYNPNTAPLGPTNGATPPSGPISTAVVTRQAVVDAVGQTG